MFRQYYITDYQTWADNIHIWHPQVGSQWMHLIQYKTDQATLDDLWGRQDPTWDNLPEVQDWKANGSQILISGSLGHEIHAELWQGNQLVTLFPHSVYEAGVMLGDTVVQKKHAYKRFQQKHLDKLSQLFSIKPNHTVWDVHDAVTAINPGVRLTRPY